MSTTFSLRFLRFHRERCGMSNPGTENQRPLADGLSPVPTQHHLVPYLEQEQGESWQRQRYDLFHTLAEVQNNT